jgi:hypothetical protein
MLMVEYMQDVVHYYIGMLVTMFSIFILVLGNFEKHP